MRKTIITMHAHTLTEQDVSGLSLAPTTPAPLSEDMPTLAPTAQKTSVVTVSGNFNPYESIRILPLAMVFAIVVRSGF